MRWRLEYKGEWHNFEANTEHGAKIKATQHLRRHGYRPNERSWWKPKHSTFYYREFYHRDPEMKFFQATLIPFTIPPEDMR